MAKDTILHHLAARLDLVECRKQNPEIEREEVRRPVFISGLPRTGTTLLYNLLAQDPKHRVPLGWEVLYPCPPPESESYLTDPRIEKARKRYAKVEALSPNLQAIHPVGALLPEECSTITMFEFQSRNFDYVYDIPSFYHWYVNRPQDDVYAAHRRYLQHLQFRAKKERWLLKAPQHLPFISDLFRVYSDAEVIFTHRAPTQVIPSMASLIYHMRYLTQRSVDPARIGREQLERWGWALDRCLAARDAMADKSDQIVDLKFDDLIRDPLAAVEGIYDHFGWHLDDDIRERMRRFLERNPREKHGTHSYVLEMFDLTPNEVNQRFAAYAERFDLRS